MSEVHAIAKTTGDPIGHQPTAETGQAAPAISVVSATLASAARPGSAPPDDPAEGYRAVLQRLPSDTMRQQFVSALGHQHGNDFVQRLVARQPDGSSGSSWSFSPTKPNASDAQGSAKSAAASILEKEAAIAAWLDKNVAEVNLWAMGMQPMDTLVAKARQNVPEAKSLSDPVIRKAILDWAQKHNVKPQPGTAASGDVLRARIEAAVQGAMSLASDGVTVTLVERKAPGGGNKVTFEVNVSVQGATATLKLGDTEISGNVAYDKGVKAQVGNDQLNFSAELTPQSWSLKLNIGLDPEVPDLSSLGGVFGKAQRGLADLVAHPNKQSQSDVADALRSAGDAFDALQAIAKSPNVSASIGLGSPDDNSTPGVSGIPKGWQINLTVTGKF